MPKSLLDEFNEQMAMAQQGTAQFAKAGQQYAQRSAADELRASLPTIMQSKDPNVWAKGIQMADAAGDQGTQMFLQKKIMEDASPKSAPLTFEQVRKIHKWIPEEQATYVSGLKTADAQNEAISQIGKSQDREFQQMAETRRKDQVFKDFKTSFDKEYRIWKDADRNMDMALKSLDMGRVTADNVVMNVVARQVSGEKGPLSDSDIARIIAPNLGMTVDKFMNFMTSGDESVLSSDQKKTLGALVKQAKGSVEKMKNEVLGYHLNNAMSDFGFMGGKIHPSIEKRAKQAGFDLSDVDGEKQYSLRSPSATVSYDPEKPESLIPMADKMVGRDPQADRWKKYLSDPKISKEEKIKKIKDRGILQKWTADLGKGK